MSRIPQKEEFEEMMIERHTAEVHNKLKNAHVAIAGLGGLGSNIAAELARLGVGHLHLVDFDLVELSNLNRQMYFVSHLGMYKTEALKSELKQINPYLEVSIDTVRVTEENAAELFAGEGIVCEAFDDPSAKAMLVNTLLEYRRDVKIVAGSGMAGYESSNTICTRKIGGQLYLCGDGKSEVGMQMCLMAPRVTICAAHQANMVLRLILGLEEE